MPLTLALYLKEIMLTDSFHKRYPNRFFYGDRFPPEAARMLVQAGQIIAEDLYPKVPKREEFYRAAHSKLSREYGAGRLHPGDSYEEICLRFIFERYDLWNDHHGDQDFFFKIRMGLIELLFREVEKYLQSELNSGDLGAKASLLAKRVKPKRKNSAEQLLESHIRAVSELNSRFQEANIPFAYHTGYIQLVDDQRTQEEIEEPFWELVAERKWANVDYEMKEALDRRDADSEDAVTYALKALESTIKIICEDRGWASGSERGASNYIDNLVSKSNGRFIDVWESEAMKHLFTNLRNPRSHGAGSQPRPKTEAQQRNWAIESCMSWIKSLVRRSGAEI